MDWAKRTVRRDEKHLSFGIWYDLYITVWRYFVFYRLHRGDDVQRDIVYAYLDEEERNKDAEDKIFCGMSSMASALAKLTYGSENSTVTKFHVDIIKWKFLTSLLSLCERNPPVTDGLPHEASVTQSFDVFFMKCAWTNNWVNSGVAGDLRRHDTHCDITVIWLNQWRQWWKFRQYNDSSLLMWDLRAFVTYCWKIMKINYLLFFSRTFVLINVKYLEY